MPARFLTDRKPTWYVNWLNIGAQFIKFALVAVVAVLIYYFFFRTIFTRNIHFFTYIAFWIFTAYIVLPWFNRRIAKLYVPDYFIGRARTGDGLLGDPINLALYGTKQQLVRCFKDAGWVQAEPLSLRSSLRIVRASITGSSYPSAPVSSLFLFNRKQNVAFQKEIDGNPRRRHHVRFWKTPDGWRLPGGETADWLGAATYDKHIGISLFTGQITHKIDADVDEERDYIIASIRKTDLIRGVRTVKNFTSSYHSHNGGGDMIYTDGSLPFITLGKRPSAAASASGSRSPRSPARKR